MKKVLPESGKLAKDAKECCQECVSEFISFITSEASERCQNEKRKTINGEDLLYAMQNLGFENYVEPLKLYLSKYREAAKGDKGLSAVLNFEVKHDPNSYLVDGGSAGGSVSNAAASTTNSSLSNPSTTQTAQQSVSALLQQLSSGPQQIFFQTVPSQGAGGAGGSGQLVMATAGGVQIPVMAATSAQLSPKSGQTSAQQQQTQMPIFFIDNSGNLQIANAAGNGSGQLLFTGSGSALAQVAAKRNSSSANDQTITNEHLQLVSTSASKS